MPTPLPDPNWLFSTIVQSTAAFVAIIAGFILNRLLTKVSEKSNLIIRVKEIRIELETTQKNIDELDAEIREIDLSRFFGRDDVLRKIIEQKSKVTISELRTIDEIYYPDKFIKQYLKNILATIGAAEEYVQMHYDEIVEIVGEDPETFFEHKLSLSYIESKIYTLIFLEEKQKRRRSVSSSLDKFSSNSMIAAALVGYNHLALAKFPEPVSINTYENRLHDDLSGLHKKKNALKYQLENMEKLLKQIEPPQDIRQGFWILGYLSIVGIILPLVVMPMQNDDQWFSVSKITIILLFVVGLGLFFKYLISQYQNLSK